MLPDKHKIGERFWKNKETYKQQASVQKILCEYFTTTLISYDFPLQHILEIGCGTGFLTEEILKQIQPISYTANDIAENMKYEIDSIATKYHYPNLTFLAGDAEKIKFPKQLDTIISTSTLQWFYDIPSFFKKTHESLSSDGIFAFSTFGLQNFIEIKNTLEKGLDYLPEQKIKEYLEPYFTIINCSEWTENLWFNTPHDVLQHIKQTGVSGFGGTYFGKEKLKIFSSEYKKKYETENKVSLTYNPIIFIAKKK